MSKGISVQTVLKDSIAEEVGIEMGDFILEINGYPIEDILDYRFLVADENIVLGIQKPNGEVWEIDIEKDFDEALGIEFSSLGLEKTIRCQNNCVFCFVSQMPPAMRKTLYVKDDDYRLSFLQGNFVTLTNLGEREIERIIEQQFSPLYVSVHTTDGDLRKKLMGNSRAGNILKQLKKLIAGGIVIHAQIVLCPDLNDGEALEKTISDLVALWPGLASLAVVPVGLTAYRQGLYPLKTYTHEKANELLEQVIKWQSFCENNYSHPILFASDEFYLLAKRDIPENDFYRDYPQIENGVGLVRVFLNDWNTYKKDICWDFKKPLSLRILTGKLAYPILKPFVEELNNVPNLKIEISGLENNFFGNTVTVAGLLTASDILDAFKEESNFSKDEILIISKVMLRDDDNIFLDDYTLEKLSNKLGVSIIAVENVQEFFSYFEDLATK